MRSYAIMRYVIMVLILSVLTACKTIPEQYTYTSDVTEDQLIDGVSFLGVLITERDLPSEDVMKVTPEMDAFLDEYINIHNGLSKKARAISKSIFDLDRLGLKYNPAATFTAGQTFENKNGNCLAFSILYNALAKKAGLRVKFQEVDVIPSWDYADDALYVESGHVNIRVGGIGSGDLIVDIDQISPEMQLSYTILEENHVIALYYGNVAAEKLLMNNNEEAFKYFVKAIKTKADIPSFWTNLGVLYRRTGNDDYAEKAYFTALKHDNRNQAALNNLAFLYEEKGDKVQSDYYSKLVKSYQNNNPYFRFVKAQKAVKKMDYQEALDHLEYAIRKKKKEPRFYKLKSDIHASLGETRKALDAMRKANIFEAEAL